MLSLSTVGTWALVVYLLGAAFFIAHRCSPDEEGDTDA